MLQIRTMPVYGVLYTKISSAVNRLQVNRLGADFLDNSGEPVNCINYRTTVHAQCSLHVCNIIMTAATSLHRLQSLHKLYPRPVKPHSYFGFPVDDKGKIVKDSKVVCNLCNQK